MDELQLFSAAAKILKQKQNYIPRDYQTIGGMWTVDTWAVGNVRYQTMDEGYTERILSEHTDVCKRYDFEKHESRLKFYKGDLETLQRDFESIGGVV